MTSGDDFGVICCAAIRFGANAASPLGMTFNEYCPSTTRRATMPFPSLTWQSSRHGSSHATMARGALSSSLG